VNILPLYTMLGMLRCALPAAAAAFALALHARTTTCGTCFAARTARTHAALLRELGGHVMPVFVGLDILKEDSS